MNILVPRQKDHRLNANVNPIISHSVIIIHIPNQRWITMEENLRLVILCDVKNLSLLCALRAKLFVNWHFFHWSSIGGMRHPICQPQEHLSQINIMVAPETCPHNIHRWSTWTTTKEWSIWPSTLGRWYGAQLRTWSFHV